MRVINMNNILDIYYCERKCGSNSEHNFTIKRFIDDRHTFTWVRLMR